MSGWQGRPLTYTGVREDHHAVGVGGEGLDECREVGVAHLHALALGRQLAADRYWTSETGGTEVIRDKPVAIVQICVRREDFVNN